MNILAIETTGANASVSIINEEGQVFTESSSDKLNHLQHLVPMMDTLLDKCRLTIDDVTYIAASEGPGSFTGIRIGVSTARAIAQGKGIDTISVPTLKSFLYQVPEYRGIICPIFDARRSQVYGGAYQWVDQKSYREVLPGDAYDLADMLEQLEAVSGGQEVMFFGDGIDSYQKMIMDWSERLQNSSPNNNIRVLFAKEELKLQTSSSVAKLALELYKAGEIKNLFDLKPVYMRKAEAERKLEASSK